MDFGITNETKSNNATPFSPRFTKGYLTDVKHEEIGKDTKYKVLSFFFRDVEGIKTFKHIEWVVDMASDNADKKMNGMNVRIKHLYTCFQPFPEKGIGSGAKTFEEFFDAVAKAFNEGRDGKKIYTIDSGDKQAGVPVWIKAGYNNRGEVSFSLSPNFIEKIGALNQAEPKTLNWDKRYDRDEQPNKKSANPLDGAGVVGGGGAGGESFDF